MNKILLCKRDLPRLPKPHATGTKFRVKTSVIEWDSSIAECGINEEFKKKHAMLLHNTVTYNFCFWSKMKNTSERALFRNVININSRLHDNFENWIRYESRKGDDNRMWKTRGKCLIVEIWRCDVNGGKKYKQCFREYQCASWNKSVFYIYVASTVIQVLKSRSKGLWWVPVYI